MNSTVLRIVLGAIVFGALMAVREELSQPWARHSIAAVAFGLGAWLITSGRSNRSGS